MICGPTFSAPPNRLIRIFHHCRRVFCRFHRNSVIAKIRPRVNGYGKEKITVFRFASSSRQGNSLSMDRGLSWSPIAFTLGLGNSIAFRLSPTTPIASGTCHANLQNGDWQILVPFWLQDTMMTVGSVHWNQPLAEYSVYSGVSKRIHLPVLAKR
jgi:hypothetical protein